MRDKGPVASDSIAAGPFGAPRQSQSTFNPYIYGNQNGNPSYIGIVNADLFIFLQRHLHVWVMLDHDHSSMPSLNSIQTMKRIIGSG